MINLSKTKYCGLWQCPKIAWLTKYKPEARLIDDDTKRRMESGNMVGDLAMGLFGDYVEVTTRKPDGKLDLSRMIARTTEEMRKGTNNICEASFSYQGLYCAVDILKKDGEGWAIYEVKSSTKHIDEKGRVTDDKEVYIADISYQKYVLEHCGVIVTRTYLVCLNGDYVFNGTLDLTNLFFISDVTESVVSEIKNIESNLVIAEAILDSEDEPDIDLSLSCHKPYHCAFWNYCAKDIPKESVFCVHGMHFDKRIEYYRNGWITYQDLLENAPIKNEKQLRQLEYGISDKGTYINKSRIEEFLKTLSYPLYFLDFESMQPAVPVFAGTHPYSQIPFQYSLHYIENEGGELKHKEFLAESGPDPRRTLAEQLCRDIPQDVCVVVYNKSFERSVLKELSEAFSDIATHLQNIRDNIKDLWDPFRSGAYYNRAMGGSFSIKSVLPAVFPKDPSLDYHNLEGVHHGVEAMTLFPQIQNMPFEEQQTARRNLLKYCELDTYAMVKLWQELLRVVEEE